MAVAFAGAVLGVAGLLALEAGSPGRLAAAGTDDWPKDVRGGGNVDAGVGVARFVGLEGEGRDVSGRFDDPDNVRLCAAAPGVPPNELAADLSRSKGDGRSRAPKCP